jgi:hypothetical protein
MNADAIDAGRLTLALNDLRLPTIKTIWPDFAARADKEGWPAARFLASLAEHEMAERANRRIRRNVEEARLPVGKTLDSFDFDAVPMVSKAQIMALAAGDSWLDQGANLMFLAHLAEANLILGQRWVWHSWRTDGASCTRAPQILSRSSRPLGEHYNSKRPSPNSTSIICSSSTTSPTSPRIRPRPACCSNSLVPDMNGDPC